jgi:hypothetical protein
VESELPELRLLLRPARGERSENVELDFDRGAGQATLAMAYARTRAVRSIKRGSPSAYYLVLELPVQPVRIFVFSARLPVLWAMCLSCRPDLPYYLNYAR